MNLNKLLLAGNLTRAPEMRYTQGGTAVCKFGLAVNRRYVVNGEKREDTCFVDCTAFGKTGEVIEKYFDKGKPIFIEGRLSFSQWEDKQTGDKRSKLEVVVESFQFVGSGKDSDSAKPKAKAKAKEPETGADAFDDEIPFGRFEWPGA